MGKIVPVICFRCGRVFNKSVAEFNRSTKLGRRHFCSRTCTGYANVGNLPIPTAESAKHLKGRELDEFSPFRKYLGLAKNMPKSQPTDVSCVN